MHGRRTDRSLPPAQFSYRRHLDGIFNMKAYEKCLGATSTKAAPWFVVPADDKYNARLIISRVITDALRGLKMSFPQVTSARRDELRVIREQLTR